MIDVINMKTYVKNQKVVSKSDSQIYKGVALQIRYIY